MTVDASNLSPVNLLKDELDQVNQFYNIVIDFFSNYSFQLIGAVIIFFIGYVLAGKIANVVLRICEKHKLDVTKPFFNKYEQNVDSCHDLYHGIK